MANPTSIDGEYRQLITNDTGSSVAVNPDRQYELVHMGRDSTGNAQTTPIHYGGTSVAALDYGEDSDTITMDPGDAFPFGPGKSTLYFKSATGGSASLGVIPGERQMGDF